MTSNQSESFQDMNTDQFHLDSRLEPTNFKILGGLNSRQQINVRPIETGPYKHSNKNLIRFKYQNPSSLWDSAATQFGMKVTNNTADKYVFSDGLMSLMDNVEIYQGNVLLEKIEYGARYSEHLKLASHSQEHYDYEENALERVWKYRSFNRKYSPIKKDGYTLKFANTDELFSDQYVDEQDAGLSGTDYTIDVVLFPHHLSFFRNPQFKTSFIEYEILIKLPEPKKIMNQRADVASGWGAPDYTVESAVMTPDVIYPNQSIIDSLFSRVNSSEGLSLILDDSIEFFKKNITENNQNIIDLTAQFSNVQGLMMMVVDSQDADANDNISVAPIPSLESYSVLLANSEVAVRGGVKDGLTGAYREYRKLYNMLSDITGQGMLDFERFKDVHTPLCLSTEILRDAPASTLRNSLETTTRAGAMTVEINVGTASDLKDKTLLIGVLHKRIVNLAQQTVSVGT